MPLAKGTHVGPYEIVGWLGAGGMGDVYRARDSRLGRDVAIKVIAEAFAEDASRVQRFELEARAASLLSHPNILAVYDVGSDGGAPYIVSELLEGESLRTRLQLGALPWRKAADYARQIADGLAAAHDKHLVHRDVKPDNLFITTDGRIKILDFGIVKLTRPDEAPSRPCGGRDEDQDRRRARHCRLHVAPAGLRRHRGRPFRPVQPRGGALRDARGPSGLRARDVGGDHDGGADRGAAAYRPTCRRRSRAWSSRCLEKSPQRAFPDRA